MAEQEPSIGATSEWFTPPECLGLGGPRTSPSHGENRGSSPLGSASKINKLHFCALSVSRLCPAEILASAS